jgi:hypothetical protein
LKKQLPSSWPGLSQNSQTVVPRRLSILRSAASALVAISASSSSLLLSAALALVPCLVELLRLRHPRRPPGSDRAAPRPDRALSALCSSTKIVDTDAHVSSDMSFVRSAAAVVASGDSTGIYASNIEAFCDSGSEASDLMRTSWGNSDASSSTNTDMSPLLYVFRYKSV